MIRTELREHIFKLLFQEEFNREEDMQEHLKYYFMTLENAADKDKDYIQEKYEAVAGHIAEIDELINQYARMEDYPDEQGRSCHFKTCCL
mgnify:CR=1 FL=1